VPDAGPAGAGTQKKTLIATERDETARATWRADMAEVDPAPVLFLDETSTQVTLTRNHGANITCLVAMGPTGLRVPCVFEGAVDSTLFLRWVRDWLVPTLAPGTTVVLDNLNVHRNADVRSAIEAAGGHLVYLPAYSPDFNPIELAFAKLKAYLRAVAARAFDPLMAAIGDGLARISARDIAGYYRHCGFALPIPDEQPL
jgi:hypothetical protein